MTLPTDLPVLAFADQAALEAWLEAEHATAPGLYVKIAKKGSGVPSVNWEQMVEVLLCFGWIDGRGQPARRLASTCSGSRRGGRRASGRRRTSPTVERLIAEGRMRPAGLAAVEAAKADGRWERAYAGPATITVPDDLAAALDADPAARAAFDALDGQNRYAVLHRVHTATTDEDPGEADRRARAACWPTGGTPP